MSFQPLVRRHAAALALVGWYLMMPPPPDRPNGPVDISASLSRWEIIDSFDGAEECSKYRFIIQGFMADPTTGKKRDPTPRGAAAVCISTDDPRLKSK
jgi:hypothetical protein